MPPWRARSESGWYVLGQEVTRLRGGVRRLAGRDRGRRLRQRHGRAGAGTARAGRRAGHERGDGVAHRGCHGRRDRDGRRDAGADRHRAGLLHDGPRRTGRGAGASAGRRPADPRGDPGASLRPAGRAGADRRGVPPAWRRGDRGLRAGAWRHASRAARSAPSPRSRRSASIRPRTSARWATAAWWRRRMPGLAADIAALRQYGWRTPLHQRRGRREQPARRNAGGDPAREAAPPRSRRTRGGRAIAAAYDAALQGTIAGAARRGATASATCSTCTCCARRSVPPCRRGCARRGSAPASTTPARCTLQPAYQRTRGARAFRMPRDGNRRRHRCSACRSIPN